MRKRKTTNRIVVHHSLSKKDEDISTITEWHKKRKMKTCGYHYYIKKDGTNQEGRQFSLIGAHALGKNKDSIGICLSGDFRTEEPTMEQLKKLIMIIRMCNSIYGKKLAIEPHRKNHNACPGKKMKKFLEIIKFMV